MTRVTYNGNIIELKDKLEKGERELDLITQDDINLEDTMELNLKLDDTLNLSEELQDYYE